MNTFSDTTVYMSFNDKTGSAHNYVSFKYCIEPILIMISRVDGNTEDCTYFENMAQMDNTSNFKLI